MMIDVVCPQHQARELLQQVVLFVGGAIRADDANRGRPSWSGLLELVAISSNACSQVAGTNLPSRLISGCRQALGIVREVEGVAALHTKEVAVDAALVAIVAANNLHAGIGATYAQRGLASVAAMRADGADVLHLPRPSLVTIGSRGQRADRANVDTHAALFALQMIFFIRRDDGAEPRF